jgi:ribosomal protein L37AE/L43A
MKLLLLDIETAPNLAYVWGIWKQNINPEWIAANGYVLCWTAKWYGEEEIFFKRLHKNKPASLLGPIHKLLNEADAVIHYNGQSFDIPTLNKEFIVHKMKPPSPYKQIDLLLTMREQFRFPSNKLDYIAQTLKIGAKIRHAGPQLWLDCMEDKREAWKNMEAYNRQDVLLLEKLYEELKPWIKRHPNVAAYEEIKACPTCGSEKYQRRGMAIAAQLKYIRYQCGDCGVWFRGVASETTTKRKDRVAPIAA